jgi:hypothetical protein
MSTCKKPLAIGIAKSDEGSQLSIGGNVLVHVVSKTTQTSELVQRKSVIWPKTLTAKPFKYVPPNNTEVRSRQSETSKSVPTINAVSSQTPKTSQLNMQQPSESTLHRTRANVTQQMMSPLVPPVARKDTTSKKGQDRILNYGMQVIQLGVFLLQLDDTEREGDGERMMRNWKLGRELRSMHLRQCALLRTAMRYFQKRWLIGLYMANLSIPKVEKVTIMLMI